jgi:hypothetical protein
MAAAVVLSASTFSCCNTSCRVRARTFDPYRCDRFAGRPGSALRTQSRLGDWNVRGNRADVDQSCCSPAVTSLLLKVIVFGRARGPRDSRLGLDGGSDAPAGEADADILREQRVAPRRVDGRTKAKAKSPPRSDELGEAVSGMAEPSMRARKERQDFVSTPSRSCLRHRWCFSQGTARFMCAAPFFPPACTPGR